MSNRYFTEPAFDREKFLAAVHFIIEQCSDKPEVLGKTKLHKSLYYSDMLHYFAYGEAVTGVEYVKAPFGPTARYLDWALRQLEDQEFISATMEEYFGLGKYRYQVTAPFVSNRLSESEKNLMKEVISFVCEHSAREISEFSHAAPWQGVDMGQRISYSTAELLMPVSARSQAEDRWIQEQANQVARYKRA